MSARPLLVLYRAGYCVDIHLGVACPIVLYRAGYDMDTRHGVSSPVTHRCLHTPLSHKVLVTAWTYVLVSARPLIPFRAGYWMDTCLGVCMPHDPIPCWLRHGHLS